MTNSYVRLYRFKGQSSFHNRTPFQMFQTKHILQSPCTSANEVCHGQTKWCGRGPPLFSSLNHPTSLKPSAMFHLSVHNHICIHSLFELNEQWPWDILSSLRLHGHSQTHPNGSMDANKRGANSRCSRCWSF